MKLFLQSLLPYTRKAWGALAGAVLSAFIVVMQSDDLLGWIGTLPSPWNQLVLSTLPFLTMWAVRERGRYGGA